MSSTTVSKDAINYNTNYIKTARYFFIQLESTTENNMNYAEIQIYNENGTNIALNKNAIQDSQNGSYTADKAVNGSLTDFHHTTSSDTDRKWWGVDLVNDETIADIKIYGRDNSTMILINYSRNAPFRIFLYKDADYPNSSFIDGTSGGPGPLDYNTYTYHSDQFNYELSSSTQGLYTLRNNFVLRQSDASPQPGTVVMWSGETLPDHALFCNGASISKIGIYADLFAEIGFRYGGTDNGADTESWFNLPDFTDRYLFGRTGAMADCTSTNSGGNWKIQEFKHNHKVSIDGYYYSNSGSGTLQTDSNDNTHDQFQIRSSTLVVAANTTAAQISYRPAYTLCNFIIYY
tara:strand:+ start:1714 stop:2754 length:1041 start_codon:yes stop_codon:yes gene_type:complete